MGLLAQAHIPVCALTFLLFLMGLRHLSSAMQNQTLLLAGFGTRLATRVKQGGVQGGNAYVTFPIPFSSDKYVLTAAFRNSDDQIAYFNNFCILEWTSTQFVANSSGNVRRWYACGT